MGTTNGLGDAGSLSAAPRGAGRSASAPKGPRAAALACACASALAAAAAGAQTARPPKPAIGCLIVPERVADVGSPVVGVVKSMSVDIGSIVRAGQPLVVLRADVESANLHAAAARSQVDADVLAAQANLELARQRHQRAIELETQGFVSPQATDQARAEQEVAAQKLELARNQKRVSLREFEVVQAQLGLRTVRSPFGGVVTDRHVHPGERVEEKPLLRLAMLDPLRVELIVPASRYGTVVLNEAVTVQPDLPSVAPVSARVTHIDPVIDAASNTFRVRLTLPNPRHKLPAGVRCRVDLAPAAAPAPKATDVPAARQSGGTVPRG